MNILEKIKVENYSEGDILVFKLDVKQFNSAEDGVIELFKEIKKPLDEMKIKFIVIPSSDDGLEVEVLNIKNGTLALRVDKKVVEDEYMHNILSSVSERLNSLNIPFVFIPNEISIEIKEEQRMDKLYFIYGLGTCSLNEKLKYECKKIKKGDDVVLEHLWFVTEDEQKAKDMIRLNITDLNDGGIYPYLGLQEVCLNDIIPKQSPMLIYLYNKVKNEYIEIGYVNNLVKDESEIGFMPNFAE